MALAIPFSVTQPPKGMKTLVLRLALRAYRCAHRKRPFRKPLLTVIDYSLPSNRKRLWVLDVRKKLVRYYEWVSHGKNTGGKWARHFSNRPNSLQSSLGLFRTAQTYYGRNGYSLRLDGLEKGINHLARKRSIVMHGAWYVSKAFIRKHGRLGRSWGCPALRKRVNRTILNTIKHNSALFIYYPDKTWRKTSRYLRCSSK